jgi:hypothetical protein
MGGWVLMAANRSLLREKFWRVADLASRSEGASEQVAAMKSFVSSSKMTLSLATMLHNDLPITPTVRGCDLDRSARGLPKLL